MIGLVLFIAIGAMFAALGVAAMRYGVDTRDWQFSIR